MVAIDSNILLRAHIGDGAELAARATRFLSRARPGSLLVDRLILEECSYVLKSMYGYEKQDIVYWMTSVINDERFYVSDRELVGLTIDVFGQEQPLSFKDSWLLALKRSGKVTAVKTFDEASAKCSRYLTA